MKHTRKNLNINIADHRFGIRYAIILHRMATSASSPTSTAAVMHRRAAGVHHLLRELNAAKSVPGIVTELRPCRIIVVIVLQPPRDVIHVVPV